MLNSTEIRNFVIEGYRNILGRETDPGGFEYFCNEISLGRMTKEQFLYSLKTSEEYKIKFGNSDTIIILILGRFGDSLISLAAAKWYKNKGKRVIWYTSEIYADFYNRISYIDKVVPVPVIMTNGNINTYESFWGKSWNNSIDDIIKNYPFGCLLTPSINPWNLKKFFGCDTPFLQFVLSLCNMDIINNENLRGDILLPDLSDFVRNTQNNIQNNTQNNTHKKLGLILNGQTLPIGFRNGYLPGLFKTLHDNNIELYNLSIEKIDSVYVNNDKSSKYIDMPKNISEMDFIVAAPTGLHVMTLALGIPNILIFSKEIYGGSIPRSTMSYQKLDKIVDTQDYFYSQNSPPEELASIILSKINNKFITEGYRNILGREPDPGGFECHRNEISSGRMTRETFLEMLKASEEYKIKKDITWRQ